MNKTKEFTDHPCLKSHQVLVKMLDLLYLKTTQPRISMLVSFM